MLLLMCVRHCLLLLPTQVCTDYLSACDRAMARNAMRLVDRQLAAAPLSSTEGQDYLAAMAAAANFAFANRSVGLQGLLLTGSAALQTHDAADVLEAMLGLWNTG